MPGISVRRLDNVHHIIHCDIPLDRLNCLIREVVGDNALNVRYFLREANRSQSRGGQCVAYVQTSLRKTSEKDMNKRLPL